MALNKFMHSRNIYRTPPDFTKLSKSYEDFSKISKLDVTGKVFIDFKDPNSLRILTKCLLKSDFGLDVVIPEDRLVPTLPLRLNYILWIEDLMNAINRKENIRGIDIGTGACAIYLLLSAAKNKWHMLGTETDQKSFQKAQENIHRNNLEDLVKLLKNPTVSLIGFLFTEGCEETYDFCMCNPPFYSNIQELCESRSPARLPPKNAFTGSPQELITDGGEIAFCRKLIKESKTYKDKILIFTTMVGHKYSLKELAQDLKADGIEYTTTEFCQGRVTRWGLAWTYQKFEISKLVPGRDKTRKKNVPIVYILPKLPDSPHDLQTASKKLLTIIKDLKIEYKILNKRGNCLSLDVKAAENTWSNQRRKRRMMKLQQNEPKIMKSDKIANSIHGDLVSIETPRTRDQTPNKLSIEFPSCSQSKLDIAQKDQTKSFAKHNIAESSYASKAVEVNKTNISDISQPNDNMDCGSEYAGINNSVEAECLVHAIFKISKKDDILLTMEFLDGTYGKEGVHQIMQYIKNNWK